MASWEPPIIVLGLAERAKYVRDGNTNLSKWNVLGFKHVLLAHFYPQSINGIHVAVAIRPSSVTEPIKLRIVSESGFEAGTMTIATSLVGAAESVPERLVSEPRILIPQEGWLTAFIALRAEPALTITAPGRYRFVITGFDGTEQTVGEFYAVVISPPPLTPERIAAIRSDPNALKAVKATLQCRKCSSKLTVVAGLGRGEVKLTKGEVWYSDVLDQHVCECGASTFDLRSMRAGMHGMLGNQMPVDVAATGYRRMYERSALENTLAEFAALIEAKPLEEPVQKYIESHPVLLHLFSAERLFFKPAILTFFKADFAILTPQKELLLVEIERPSTRILKKNGDEAADLHHAIDQVQRWLQVVAEHRAAVLASLELDSKDVSAIRGVVVAGRDHGNDAQQLRRLKGVDRGAVKFLTFDDLAASLATLVKRIEAL